MLKTKIVGAVVAALLALTIIGVAGWQFNWWLAGKNANRQATVLDQTANAQRGYREAARAAIKVVLDPASTAAFVSFNTSIACANIASLNTTFKTPELVSFEFANCPRSLQQ